MIITIVEKTALDGPGAPCLGAYVWKTKKFVSFLYAVYVPPHMQFDFYLCESVSAHAFCLYACA